MVTSIIIAGSVAGVALGVATYFLLRKRSRQKMLLSMRVLKL